MTTRPLLSGPMTPERQYTRALLDAAMARHGDAVYLVDAPRYGAELDRFRGAFQAVYPDTRIGHSYKTNCLPPLCRAAEARGSYAEVVSRMEYDMAIRFGVSADRIIVNGPVKDAAFLGQVLADGAFLNVDSLEELDVVVALARAHPGRRCRIGVRCAFAMPAGPRSRFGIDADGPDLDRAAALIAGAPGVALAGLHCHFSSGRRLEDFEFRTRRMLELADRLFPGSPPEYIDLGGGFCSAMPDELRRQFDTTLPTFEEYAGTVGVMLVDRYGAAGGPRLILEPGLALLASAMAFACKVAVTKETDGQAHAIATGSVFDIKPFLGAHELPLAVLPAPDAAPRSEREWTISGSTCVERDVMRRRYRGRLGVGDVLVFAHVGAYSIAPQGPFLRAVPAVLASADDGSLELVRRASDLGDVLALFETDRASRRRP